MKAEKSTTVTTDPYEVERIDENIGHCYCRRLEAATSPKLNFKSKATRRVACPIPGIFGGTRDPSIGILNADSSPFTGNFPVAGPVTKLRDQHHGQLMRTGNTRGTRLS
jgi:hypothetical protein